MNRAVLCCAMLSHRPAMTITTSAGAEPILQTTQPRPAKDGFDLVPATHLAQVILLISRRGSSQLDFGLETDAQIFRDADTRKWSYVA